MEYSQNALSCIVTLCKVKIKRMSMEYSQNALSCIVTQKFQISVLKYKKSLILNILTRFLGTENVQDG